MADPVTSGATSAHDRAPRTIDDAIALVRGARERQMDDAARDTSVTEATQTEAAKTIAEMVGTKGISDNLETFVATLPQVIADRAMELAQPARELTLPTGEKVRLANSNLLASLTVEGLPAPIIVAEEKGWMTGRKKKVLKVGEQLPASVEKALIVQSPGYKALEKAIKGIPDLKLSVFRGVENTWHFEVYFSDARAKEAEKTEGPDNFGVDPETADKLRAQGKEAHQREVGEYMAAEEEAEIAREKDLEIQRLRQEIIDLRDEFQDTREADRIRQEERDADLREGFKMGVLAAGGSGRDIRFPERGPANGHDSQT